MLQRNGTLSKGLKWFDTQMQDPSFRARHIKQRELVVDEFQNKTAVTDGTIPPTMPTTVALPELRADDVAIDRGELKEKGAYEVYTEKNYAKYHNGRTWEQDDLKLIPKRMANGEIKQLIFVWEGDEDRWTMSRSEISDIERRSGILNTGMANVDESDVRVAASNAAPSLLPDVFQVGMEDAEILQLRP